MDHSHLFCLAAIVAMSLVLPLYAGSGTFRGALDRRTALRWVWTCQIVGVIAGLAVIAAPIPLLLGPVVAAIGCATCLTALHRRRIA